jgi:hypothetical protein
MHGSLPVTTSTTILLDFLGIDVCMAALGEESRQMLRRRGGAVSETLVVTVVGLVGASH